MQVQVWGNYSHNLTCPQLNNLQVTKTEKKAGWTAYGMCLAFILIG